MTFDSVDPALRTRLDALCREGWTLWERFDREVREREFHPFVAADYGAVLEALIVQAAPGRRFLELGSATGVITIMADLLGFHACGIELDAHLVAQARALAARFDSRARFVAGDFIPAGFRWRPAERSEWTDTRGSAPSGYLQLGHALDDFDVVFGYPWGGEKPLMLDLMKRYGRKDVVLLLYGVDDGVTVHGG